MEDLAPLAKGFKVEPLAPGNFEHWRSLAVGNNAQLIAQRHAVEVADHGIERNRAGHLPSLSAYASTGRSSSSSESTYNQRYDTDSVGIQLSMPLFAGGGVSAATRQATAQRDQVQYQLDGLLNETLNELRKQFNLCASSVAKIRAYELAEDSADRLIEATRKSVAGGERVNLDVLNAEQQLYSARRDLAQARYDYLRAWLQVHYLAGTLEASDLQKLDRYFVSRGAKATASR